ncbi:four-helix bundle copper-binding protein [Actinoplanes sp. NPDC049316]|uniref:four-helix bundle copper-binding protein n=1 Tax=Actinoplanes sp. NPDC049316 TaxID=3154727 RepID=UPI00341A68E4
MTTTIRTILGSGPAGDLGADELATLAETVIACGQTCAACADSCLGSGFAAGLTECIGLDLACADICATTARVLARPDGRDTAIVRALLQACAVACAACADECLRHVDSHRHCGTCAQMCRVCEEQCRSALMALG